MRQRRPTARLAAVFLIPTIILVACGGATSSPGAAGSGAVPPTGAVPSTGGVPSAGVDPASLGAIPSFAIPSFELGSLIANLGNVDSYKVVIAGADGTAYSGTIVTKPVLARDLYLGSGAGATHIVKIGDETWVGTADGPLKVAPAGMVDSMLPLFDPGTLLSIFANASVLSYAADLGEEVKNGQPTTHYKVNLADIPNFAAFGMPATATVETWVADDGYLVSFIATDYGAAGRNMHIDVTNVNDPANVVERPS